MADPVRFWNRIAEKYAADPIADEQAYRHKLALTQQRLDPSMTALEFGCGTGSTAFEHAPHVRRYLAVDAAPAMIAICERKQRERLQPNLEFRVGTVEAFAPDGGPVDVVLLLSLLHLVEDRHAVLARVHDLLAPGGLLVTSTACLRERMGFLRPIMPIGALLGFFPSGVGFFTRAQLRQDVTEAGFAIVEDYEQKGSGDPLFLIARREG
jgi:2-polyprenyl-3-methyl-5-hydroxy-6-metoxy-1,4-benzoquinol methylase